MYVVGKFRRVFDRTLLSASWMACLHYRHDLKSYQQHCFFETNKFWLVDVATSGCKSNHNLWKTDNGHLERFAPEMKWCSLRRASTSTGMDTCTLILLLIEPSTDTSLSSSSELLPQSYWQESSSSSSSMISPSAAWTCWRMQHGSVTFRARKSWTLKKWIAT